MDTRGPLHLVVGKHLLVKCSKRFRWKTIFEGLAISVYFNNSNATKPAFEARFGPAVKRIPRALGAPALLTCRHALSPRAALREAFWYQLRNTVNNDAVLFAGFVLLLATCEIA